MSSDTLVRVKRAVLARHYAFSEKASLELEADGLTELDVVESIVNAVAIYKTIRSGYPLKPGQRRVRSTHHTPACLWCVERTLRNYRTVPA